MITHYVPGGLVSVRDIVAQDWGAYDDGNETPEDDLERRRLKLAAQHDFHSFMKLMHPGYVEGEHLKKLRWHLEEVANGNIKRLIVTMPPRHGKSVHVSESFPAYFLGRNPNNRVLSVSHTDDLAEKVSRRVRDKITSTDWPFRDVRIARDNGGVKSWKIEGAYAESYNAFGVGGSPAGVGGQLIVIDDPIRNQEEADSPLIREKLWDWYHGTLYTRRQPGAAIVATATRWHQDDLTGRLLEQMANGGEQWVHLHLPAEDEITGEFLWTDFWPAEEYEMAKNGSPRVWMAQYQGRPSPKQGALLKREWFPYAPHGERYLAIVQVWDSAEEPGLSNDWSVCATIGISPTSYDILDIWRDRVEFPDLLQAARDRATWGMMVFHGLPFTILIENKSSGVQLAQTLMRETRWAIEKIPAHKKNEKVQRVIDITPLAKSGRIRLLEGSPWIQVLLREFAEFPTGMHDDIVDACMIGVRYASGVGGAVVVRSRSYVNGHDDEKPFNELGMGQTPKRRLPPPGPKVHMN